jgi:hypothetical protein
MLDSLGSDNGYNYEVWGPYDEGYSDTYVRNLSVTFDVNLLGKDGSAEVGRVGHQAGGYFFQRTDYTPEYRSEAWDNGDHYFDGGILTFGFGNSDLTIFGGRNSDRMTSQGTELNGILLHNYAPGMVDQSLGFTLDTPLGDNGGLKLNYIMFDSNTVSTFDSEDVNRNTVYGGELNYSFGDLKLMGSFAQSDVGYNSDAVIDEDNTAVHGRIAYDGGNWGFNGGYREIERYFHAPGSWGRLADWYNPTDISGAHGTIWYLLNNTVALWCAFDDVEVAGDSDYTFDEIRAGLNFKLADGKRLGLSIEDDEFDYDGYIYHLRWYSVSYDQSIGENSDLMFKYTFSDHDTDGDTWARGGLLSTQVRIKF